MSIKSQAKRRVFVGAVVVEANRNLNTDNARVLVQCDGYLNLIGAISEWSLERVDYRRCLGYHRRCRIDLTEMLSITRVVGSTAPVYDVTDGRLEDINAKDALVSQQFADGKFDFSIHLRSQKV